jgi:hypothetical protein
MDGDDDQGGGETLLQSNSTVRSIPLPRHLKDKDLLIQMRFPPPPDRTTVYIERQQKKKSQGTTPGLELLLLSFGCSQLCPCLSQLYAACSSFMAPRNQTLRQDIQSILLDWRSQNVRPIHTHTKTNNLTYYYYHHHPKREEKKKK